MGVRAGGGGGGVGDRGGGVGVGVGSGKRLRHGRVGVEKVLLVVIMGMVFRN